MNNVSKQNMKNHKRKTIFSIFTATLLFSGCGGGITTTTNNASPQFTYPKTATVQEGITGIITIQTDTADAIYSITGGQIRISLK